MNDLPTLKRIKKRVDKINPDFCLGKHSLDFNDEDFFSERWNDLPVVFVLAESVPADESAQSLRIDGDYTFPKAFARRKYASAAGGAIRLFRLSNAFVTAVGENGTAFSAETLDGTLFRIAEALTQDFKDELSVFAFGQKAADAVNAYFTAKNKSRGKDDKKIRYKLCPLPAPSSSMSDDNRKYVLFGKPYKFLTAAGADCSAAMSEFLQTDGAARNKRTECGDCFDALASALKAAANLPKLVVKRKKSCRFIKSADILIETVAGAPDIAGNRTAKVICYCKNYSIASTSGVGFGYDADTQDFFIYDYTASSTVNYDELAAASPVFATLFDAFAEFAENNLC